MKYQVAVGVALCAAANLALGGSIAAVRLLLDFPLFAGQAVRYAIAAAVLVPALLAIGLMARRDLHRSGLALAVTAAEWGWLAVLAATGLVGYNVCLVIALQRADPAVVSTIVGAVPVAVAVLAPLLRRRSPSGRLLAAAVTVVAGTMLVHGAGRCSLLGALAALGALAGDTAFTLIAGKVLPRLGAVRVTVYTCLLAVPMLLAASMLAGEPTSWRAPNLTEWSVLTALGVVVTAVGFWAYFRGIQLASVERASLTVGLVPLGTVFAMVVQDAAVPPAAQLLGIGVVVVGLVLGVSAPAPSARMVQPQAVPDRQVVAVGTARVPAAAWSSAGEDVAPRRPALALSTPPRC